VCGVSADGAAELDDADKLDADIGVAVEFEGEDEDEESDGDEVLVSGRYCQEPMVLPTLPLGDHSANVSQSTRWRQGLSTSCCMLASDLRQCW